jgi:hypothetical protein
LALQLEMRLYMVPSRAECRAGGEIDRAALTKLDWLLVLFGPGRLRDGETTTRRAIPAGKPSAAKGLNDIPEAKCR